VSACGYGGCSSCDWVDFGFDDFHSDLPTLVQILQMVLLLLRSNVLMTIEENVTTEELHGAKYLHLLFH
jgi:hypothetical protein